MDRRIDRWKVRHQYLKAGSCPRGTCGRRSSSVDTSAAPRAPGTRAPSAASFQSGPRSVFEPEEPSRWGRADVGLRTLPPQGAGALDASWSDPQGMCSAPAPGCHLMVVPASLVLRFSGPSRELSGSTWSVAGEDSRWQPSPRPPRGAQPSHQMPSVRGGGMPSLRGSRSLSEFTQPVVCQWLDGWMDRRKDAGRGPPPVRTSRGAWA